MEKISEFLTAIGFELTGTNQWQRRFDYPATGEYVITVDTDKRAIDYPKPIVLGDRTTSNFDHPENFVVLECVCRLLAKGYDPATFILEKRYQVGRGASGGKSDITMLRRTLDPTEQPNAPPLLIIECKNWGSEHDAEYQKTVENGGQLFGYLQQDRAATHLCIYSSRLAADDQDIEYRSDIIHVEDTPEAQEKFDKREKSESHSAARDAVPLFRYAHNREALHHVWKATYGSTFQSSGIFEDDFTPYAIGYLPKRGKDLKEFKGENGSAKVFNQFMEILRHNSVSDKENAFNRLCAIILAKLIDEERSPDAILDFQWFPNRDTPEDLIDRLQRLYKRGMQETLGEDITYFEERDIDHAFQAHRRDVAKNEVKKIFRALKFYTNSDFAFKEVHNRKLFEQNTQVVKEVVELFQGYRLKYTSKQAFLGNLFELLLNSGFKQSEGQFFTPIPIARFIVRCLPLRERIRQAQAEGRQQMIPRVMDYACGSAHFLTEIVEEIQEDLTALGLPQAATTAWTRDHVWGIEKDYRLARTAKIAMFLHGAGDANILHEDGLDHANPALPEAGTLDVLVANPPYSVKDFKQHLRLAPQQQAQFTLLPTLTPNSSEIETLFVERAAQLLRVGGVAGLILPSSILSNAGIYQRTRALILEKFLLRGIVELGGSSFIATGTNTVILFLERRDDIHLEHFGYRADALYNDDKALNDNDFADSELLRAYTAAAGLDFDVYRDWLVAADGEPPFDLEQMGLFRAYAQDFEALPTTKTRRNQKSFNKLSKDEQEDEMRGKLLRYIREAEHEKFIYFALAHVEHLAEGEIVPQRTTVLRGAENNKEEQTLLGYKWSNRRGAEGMVYLREPYDGGALYASNSDARDDGSDKAAHHLRRAFLDVKPEDLPDSCVLEGKLSVAATPAYFDFTSTGCELAVNLSPVATQHIRGFDTKYKLVAFSELASLEYGKPLPAKDRVDGEYPVMGSNGRIGTHNAYLISGPAIIIGRKGSAGRLNYEEENCFPIDTTFYISHDPKETSLRFIYAILGELELEKEARALGVPGLNRNDVYKKVVPKPPLNIQRHIANEIEQIEADETKARDTVVQAQEAIDRILARPFNAWEQRKLHEVCALQRGRFTHRPRNDPRFFGGPYPFLQTGDIVHARGGKIGFKQTLNEKGLEVSRLVQPPVVLVTIAANIGDTAVLDYPACFTDSVVGLIPNDGILPGFLELMMRRHKEALNQSAPALAQKNINIEILRPLPIPVPSLTDQQALLDEIAQHEIKLAAAEKILAAAPEKKRKILLDGIK